MANIGYIQVTRLCNQHCRFCSNPEREATINLDSAKEQIDSLVGQEYFGVIFTGGEPTLNDILPDIIAYGKTKDIQIRMVTNGQKTADRDYFKQLVDAGIDHINVSIHSCIEKVQTFLTENPDSLKNITKTLENTAEFDIPTDVNTVINRYNANHLDKTAKWAVKNFPHVRHIVWNNIDPRMNRASKNRDTIPKMRDFEVSLYKAMKFMDSTGRTFRVERVPLCYMAEYAHCSTETRKIVKGEERITHFLDEKEYVRQTDFIHGKAECCEICLLNDVCAGMFEMDTYYDSVELYPVFIPKEVVIENVLRKKINNG
ncbi:MAG: radical SAM protein [bacterium]